MVTAYMPAIPRDPSTQNGVDVTQGLCGTNWDTGYQIMRDANNRVTVSATNAEIGATIVLTR